MDIIRGHCKVMLLIFDPDAYASAWLGSATLSHMQRAPMTLGEDTFLMQLRAFAH